MQVYLDHYLDYKRRQRRAVFEDAASSSLLMFGVAFLYKHSQYLFDRYCRFFMGMRLRLHSPISAESSWRELHRHHADAIDTYHVLWVIVTFVSYLVGWELYSSSDNSWGIWFLWMIPLALCVYRMFDISAALIEMYFGASDARHHQFRILIHAGLHFLGTSFAFALFYIFSDWAFNSFSTPSDTGEPAYQFNDWSDAIFDSFLTVVFYGGDEEPQNPLGKMLVVGEVLIGFVLATFIFLNITQIWVGNKSSR